MKVKTIKVMEDCIERGVNYGYNRAHKHNDTPSEEDVKACIADAIMNELYEYFEFDFGVEE